MAMLNITNLYENTVIGNDRAAVHDQQISALQAVAQAEVPLFQGDVATLRKQVAALQQATDVVDCQGGMTLNLQMLGAE